MTSKFHVLLNILFEPGAALDAEHPVDGCWWGIGITADSEASASLTGEEFTRMQDNWPAAIAQIIVEECEELSEENLDDLLYDPEEGVQGQLIQSPDKEGVWYADVRAYYFEDPDGEYSEDDEEEGDDAV